MCGTRKLITKRKIRGVVQVGISTSRILNVGFARYVFMDSEARSKKTQTLAPKAEELRWKT